MDKNVGNVDQIVDKVDQIESKCLGNLQFLQEYSRKFQLGIEDELAKLMTVSTTS